MNIIKSIFKDFTSLKQIILNKWHLHAFAGVIVGMVIFYFIGGSITDIHHSTRVFLKIFVPTLGGSMLCWLFERWQQYKYYGGMLNEKQGFESDKDCIVSCFFVLIGVITGFFLF